MSYFGQNGKPIALLFGENKSFWMVFNVFTIFKKFEIEQILAKMVSPQPYFLVKFGHF